MISCPNRNLREFTDLQKVQGQHMALYLWSKYKGEVPVDYYTSLNDKLINGFLKDFGISATMYDDLTKDLGLKHNPFTASDLVAKSIAYKKGESITSEVAYFAYRMLGHKNDKIRADLRFLVRKWDRYGERFRHHAEIYKKTEQYMPNKKEWTKNIADKVIVDFLKEHIENYYTDPIKFEKEVDAKFTKSDWTLWKRILKEIESFLLSFGISFRNKEDQIRKLNNIGIGIADEVLNRNYKYFDYKMGQDQIRKYYNQTIESDPRAKNILVNGQSIGLVVTGSLALRRAGTVYRTAEESVHDIDFVVPFELLSPYGVGIKPFNDKYTTPTPENLSKLHNWLQQFDFYKNWISLHPNFKLVRSFYGKEHENDFRSLTIQGVIDGEFYDSDGFHEEEFKYYKKDPITKISTQVKEKKVIAHKKGDWNKSTGYSIDFFMRLQPHQEEHENYFKLWKEIMIAKLMMGREKDFVDWTVFVPYMKSLDSYNFNYEGYRHFNYDSNQTHMMDDDAGDIKIVHQGYNSKLDDRKFNYFTKSYEEAMEYGTNVRTVSINTAFFLQGYSEEYYNVLSNYQKITGNSFDLLDNSKEGLEKQNNFFEYLLSLGFKGIDFTTHSDSNYIVEFSSAKNSEIRESEEAYNEAMEGFAQVDNEMWNNFINEDVIEQTTNDPFC